MAFTAWSDQDPELLFVYVTADRDVSNSLCYKLLEKEWSLQCICLDKSSIHVCNNFENTCWILLIPMPKLIIFILSRCSLILDGFRYHPVSAFVAKG